MFQFPSNKRKSLSIDNCNSTAKTILTCIPQGLVLGPRLFLIYLNDLHVLNILRHHFADDKNILHAGKSLEVLAKN